MTDYDQRCYNLAKIFCDENGLSHDEWYIRKLACEIQDTAESFVGHYIDEEI